MSTAVATSAPGGFASDEPRARFASRRPIEKPPQHGEKPYLQLVDEAFDGPVLKLSRRIKLLEEASTRKIRRGDALDAINATRRRLERQHAVPRKSPAQVFLSHLATFAIVYFALALAWCTVLALR